MSFTIQLEFVDDRTDPAIVWRWRNTFLDFDDAAEFVRKVNFGEMVDPLGEPWDKTTATWVSK